MRAYVITHGWHGVQGTNQLVSSKKLAIDACEKILDVVEAGQAFNWTAQDKHKGTCETMAGSYASYEMFYVNEGPNRAITSD